MASFHYPSAPSPSAKKRPRNDFDPLSDSIPKRLCPEPEQTNPHLSFLEELCDFEASLDASNLVSPTQEELVAEMMKSLEKVIEDGDGDGEEAFSHEPSSSQASSEPYSNLATPEPSTSALDSTWQYTHLEEEEHGMSHYAEPAGCNYGELDFECGQDFAASDASDCRDAQIRHLLEASDDELGIPVTSRIFPEDGVQEREDEWALLDQAGPDVPDDSLHMHALNGWLDHQFEDSFPMVRELSEAVILF